MPFIYLDFLINTKFNELHLSNILITFLMHVLNRNHFKCLHTLSCMMNKNVNFSLFLKILYKCLSGIIVSPKILSSKTVFNIDNNEKCFLSSKLAYYKDYVTLKLLFVNNNRFINISNDECCVPKCKLKCLKPSTAQLVLTVNRN